MVEAMTSSAAVCSVTASFVILTGVRPPSLECGLTVLSGGSEILCKFSPGSYLKEKGHDDAEDDQERDTERVAFGCAERGLLHELKKALMEGALTHRGGGQFWLGEREQPERPLEKTVLTDDGEVELSIPRDRPNSFDPVLVPNGTRRLASFDDKVISLYARRIGLVTVVYHYRVQVS